MQIRVSSADEDTLQHHATFPVMHCAFGLDKIKGTGGSDGRQGI